jgi:hypothetical protein
MESEKACDYNIARSRYSSAQSAAGWFLPPFFMGLRGIEWANFRVCRPKKAVHFLVILDFGEGFDLASERDDKSGETTSATVGCVQLPRISA